MHTHLDIPLAQLRLSPTNARQDPGNVESLAHSIAAVGLITPLAATRAPDAGVEYRHGDNTWSGRGKQPAWVVEALAAGRSLSEFSTSSPVYLVEAGGRRLAALQLLRDQGKITPDTLVPVMLFERADLARSVAENTEREPMDPLQQAQAFGRLLGEGRHVEDIATTFGVSVQYVRQRAKLAELVPEVVEAYRRKRLDLQQCAALTFGTPEQQRAIVADPGHLPGALQLRERLRGALIRQDDRRVRFVGLQAYQDAGGRLAEDLFASTADLIDGDLLDKLVEQKLDAECAAQVAAGMAFAHHLFDGGAFTAPEFEELETDADYDAKMDALQQEEDRLYVLRNRALDAGEDGQYAHYEASLEAVQTQMDTLADTKHRPVAPIGVLLRIDYLGNVQAEKVMRVADVRAWRESQRTTEGQPTPSATPQPAPGRQDLTVKCAEEIAQARQAALALKVAAMPQLALAIVVQWLDFAIFGCLANPDRDQPMSWHNPAPLPAHFARCNTPRPADLSEQLREVTLPQAQDRRKPFCAERTRDEQAKAAIPLEWYIDQPKTTLLQILADAVAHALTDPDSREQSTHGSVPPSARSTIRALVDACGLDLADAWKPTPAWLKSYGKAKTLQALASVDEAFAGALANAKAGEIYEKAAERLSEARWVPEFGRAEK